METERYRLEPVALWVPPADEEEEHSLPRRQLTRTHMRRRALILLVAALGLLVGWLRWVGWRSSDRPAPVPVADAAPEVRDDALVRAGSPDARAAIQEPPKPTPAASPTLRARIVAKGTQRPLAAVRISVDGAGTSQSKESDTNGRAEFA